MSCDRFLKNIHRPNPVTVVEMNVLPLKTHDIVKPQNHSARGLYFCFFYHLISPHFQRVLNESHWIQNDNTTLLKGVSLCIYMCDFFFLL